MQLKALGKLKLFFYRCCLWGKLGGGRQGGKKGTKGGKGLFYFFRKKNNKKLAAVQNVIFQLFTRPKMGELPHCKSFG